MKNNKTFALIISFVVLALACFPMLVSANAAPPPTSPGSNISPEDQTKIQIESEQVIITSPSDTPSITTEHRIKPGYLLIIAIPLIFFGWLIKKNGSKPNRP